MKRVLRGALALAAALAASAVGLAVLVLLVVLGTPVGVRLAVQALAPAVPGELAVGGVRGSLVRTLVLLDVRYSSGGMRAELDRVELALGWSELAERRFTVTRLAVLGGSLTLPEAAADGEPLGPIEPPPLPGIPEWVAVPELLVTDFTVAGLGAPIEIERVSGALDGSRLALETVALEAAGAELDASLALAVAADGASGTLEGNVLLPANGAAADTARSQISLEAAVELATAAEPWRVALEWRELTWQGSPGGDFASPAGRLAITPGTEPMALELAAELEGAALPDAASIAASAALDGDTLTVQRLHIDTLGGAITASGTASLGGLRADARIEIEGLDPGEIDPRVSGRLRARLDASVALAPALAAQVEGVIGGRLGERPLEGAVDVRYADETLAIAAAEVSLDRGRLEVTGTLSPDAADLGFSASLPELGAWYPPAAGEVVLAGAVRGDPSNPEVNLDLDARALALEGSPVPPLATLAIGVDGTRAAHKLAVSGETEIGRFRLLSEQGYADERISGMLRETALELDRAGRWVLREPAAFTLGADARSLERACFTGPGDGVLCAGLQDEVLTASAEALPNELAEPWLPEGVTVAGATDAELMLDLADPPTGSLTARQPLLTVTANAADTEAAEEQAEPVTAELADLSLAADLDEQRLRATLAAELVATGDPIQGELTLTPPMAEGELDGRLFVRLTDLALVDALVEGVEALSGEALVTAEVGGSLAAPELRGEVDVRSLSAALPPLGIEIAEGHLTATAAGFDELAVQGRVCSGGCLTLDARAELPGGAAPWSVQGSLAGERFELVALDDVRAVVSPDLQLSGDEELWRLTGRLGIPEGRLAIETVPRTAVRPAPETVVHGREEPGGRDEALPLPLVIDVTARLGDVRFEGLGITAELDGAVNVRHSAQGVWRANGTTMIEEGTFSAYGQELTIERGLLIFTGPPENPALDVRAVRTVDDALVGLDIMGTAAAPRSVVFSEPTLPESDAFARLVTGRSLESAGEGMDQDAIERAALGLGLRRALPALGRLGSNLGLDELGVGEGESGAIVAGKQLGEDVYLRYKHGLFDDFSGLELIYRITDRFRLRTETGTAQAIDLIYEVGRGRGLGGEGIDDAESIAGPEQVATPADVVAEPAR